VFSPSFSDVSAVVGIPAVAGSLLFSAVMRVVGASAVVGSLLLMLFLLLLASGNAIFPKIGTF
jgi:hypothetical protein